MKPIFKILLIIKKLFKAEIIIFPPKKSKILIWGVPTFINTFKEKKNRMNLNDIDFIYVWGEKYNLFILLKCLFKLKFSFLDYSNEYIDYTKPKLIITFLDNYNIIYNLKKNSNQKIIVIQNATRSNENNFFRKRKYKFKNKIDYFFVHNRNIVKAYQNICNANFFITGSFLSNSIPISKVKKKFDILYISTFRDRNNEKIHGSITIDRWLDAESKLINTISECCKKNGRKLTILPSRNSNFFKEKSFFECSIKNFEKVKFLKRSSTDYKYPYKIIDKAKIVIGIDSTLMYEAFSRGKRTIFFDIKPKDKFLIKNRHFCWPKKLPKYGPFWLNCDSYNSVNKIIKNVSKLTNRQWFQIKKKYEKDLMVYNKDNKIFTEKLVDTFKK